jgi:hypothetical protein
LVTLVVITVRHVRRALTPSSSLRHRSESLWWMSMLPTILSRLYVYNLFGSTWVVTLSCEGLTSVEKHSTTVLLVRRVLTSSTVLKHKKGLCDEISAIKYRAGCIGNY